jgi:hypothetical protein
MPLVILQYLYSLQIKGDSKKIGGKTVLLRMLTNLSFTDLCLTTAQQRTTGQTLPSHLYITGD